MKYKSIVATRRGGPEVLQVVESELRPPTAGQVRIKIQAAPVCQDDVAVRLGSRPFLPKFPLIAARFPFLEAAQANQLLESGQVAGNVVLLSPEFL